MNKNNLSVSASLTTRNLTDLADTTGNVYKSIAIAGKRARQVSSRIKEELNAKLAEFATSVDNLEEVFENREQIEISKYYERMPKPSTLALEEFMQDELMFRKPETDSEDNNEKIV